MQTINEFINMIDAGSLILGATAMLLIVVLFFFVKSKVKRKPTGLPILREKIKIGHEALKQANQVFSEIYSAFNDAEEVMGR